jgi:cation diffusion facilitator CzcD-associated flavoprotein CzcO
MTILVVGANGATGRLLVEQLLNRGEKVKVIVRSTDKLTEESKNHENLSVIQASLLELSDTELLGHVRGCDAIASCLGHNMTFKGMYGHPRRLVTDATRRLCQAVGANKPEKPVRFILMNTTGNSNRDIPEQISFAQRCVMALIRLLLPPHVDNEKAADYLRTQIGKNNSLLEWAAVRPDGLIDEPTVGEYEIYPSPTRSAIFDAGTASRINVGHFMAKLVTEDDIWELWKGKMPVIYNTLAS